MDRHDWVAKGYLLFHRSCRLQMDGFQGRFGHQNGPHCLFPGRIRSPRLEKFLFADSQLFGSIVARKPFRI